MKATIASIACLLMAGFVAAASVEGNNTAVVIQKSVVKSAGGWQFICVPVDGLSIAGSSESTVNIATFLPSTVYNANTVAYVVEEDGAKNVRFKLTGDTWAPEMEVVENETKVWKSVNVFPDGKSDFATANGDLMPGTILWVYEVPPAGRAAATLLASEDTKTVFCGQSRDRTVPVRADLIPGMVAMKNDSSVAVTLNGVISAPQPGDDILLLQNGKNSYKIYTYGTLKGTTTWWSSTTPREDSGTKVTIAPGEAFYYRANGTVAAGN